MQTEGNAVADLQPVCVCGGGGGYDRSSPLNYSSLAKLNSSLPPSLPSARLRSRPLFWLIHNRGSAGYRSNSGLIPGERDGPAEG